MDIDASALGLVAAIAGLAFILIRRRNRPAGKPDADARNRAAAHNRTQADNENVGGGGD